ncbi:pyruvate ferredoxin oxidoreductase beta subunit [Desulfosarcina sp. BuS5]|uniref:thiamine pyrophosphate-dependent enzyme n=1 Tax=Desulfosarcina sp. BuS5 TaxID=933262 RepID=UPI000A031E08|nr:thiamine pyrophosphate-dependent enzyme [Desulfosarcina sp. BuS5]WDN90295.1 pyruvate ferredoxin oxidoreductase beta subunit [Desulfosarcina sp. BuS5]
MVSVKELIKIESTKPELFLAGSSACAGCSSVLALRWALKALGARTVIVSPACCANVYIGLWPKTSPAVPYINMAFAAGASAAAGIVAGYESLGKKDINVLTWAGDGGTVDIGIQALSGAIERNTNFIYACYDNEGYMNTGTQRSSSTPKYTMTTTTPLGKHMHKKDVAQIIAAHDIPYAATCLATDPVDVYNTFMEAKAIHGPKYIHILSPCAPGWRFDVSETVKIGNLAVKSGFFILWKQVNGRMEVKKKSLRVLLNKDKRVPVKDYLKPQGRFRKLTEEQISEMQDWVDRRCDRMARRFKSESDL